MYLVWRDPYTLMLAALALLLPLLAGTALWRAVKRRPVLTRRLRIGLAAVAVLGAACGYITTRIAGRQSGTELRADAPAVTLRLADGRAMALSELRGKVVLMDFWATWCPPCRASSPALARLAGDFGARGLVVVGVSADDDEAAWREYVSRHGGGRMDMLDSDGEVAGSFQARGKPTFVLVDRRGRLRWRMAGWSPWSYGRLRGRTARLLEE